MSAIGVIILATVETLSSRKLEMMVTSSLLSVSDPKSA